MSKPEVGRVPSNYLVLDRYCTTRHYLDPAGYYFKIWPDPDLGIYLFLRLSTILHALECKVGICLATVFDARHCGIMRDR